MTVEENAKIVEAEVRDFFQGMKAKKHPPPEEKIDPMKVQRTIDALKRPPPSPPQTNYERITEKKYKEAKRLGSTCSDRRLAERRSGKKLPSSANKQTNRGPRSRCLAISSLIFRGCCPVPILEITCPTMHIFIQWRWTNSNTGTGSLSSNLVILL